MTLGDLDGRLFAGVTEVAGILGTDARTVRRAIAAGEIPGQRVGTKYVIPVSWLREIAGSPGRPEPPGPDPDEFADRVADRVLARFARLFGEPVGGGPEAA